MPSLARAGTSEPCQQRYWSSTSEATTEWIRRSCSWGERPSGPGSITPESICCIRPATRISKNSSRFELTIARNLTRSSRGWDALWACSSTRRSKDSQLSSRLK